MCAMRKFIASHCRWYISLWTWHSESVNFKISSIFGNSERVYASISLLSLSIIGYNVWYAACYAYMKCSKTFLILHWMQSVLSHWRWTRIWFASSLTHPLSIPYVIRIFLLLFYVIHKSANNFHSFTFTFAFVSISLSMVFLCECSYVSFFLFFFHSLTLWCCSGIPSDLLQLLLHSRHSSIGFKINIRHYLLLATRLRTRWPIRMHNFLAHSENERLRNGMREIERNANRKPRL